MEDLGEVQHFTKQWGPHAHGATRVTHELVGKTPEGRTRTCSHLWAGFPSPSQGLRWRFDPEELAQGPPFRQHWPNKHVFGFNWRLIETIGIYNVPHCLLALPLHTP